MSFIPSGKSEMEQEKDKKTERKKSKDKSEKSQFGAGLENLKNAQEETLDGEEGEGRKKMRLVKRSASNTVVRGLKGL